MNDYTSVCMCVRQWYAYARACLWIMCTYIIFLLVMTVLVFQDGKDSKDFIIQLQQAC